MDLCNYTYSIKSLVPEEFTFLHIESSAERIKETYDIDTIRTDIKYEVPELFMGPYLESVKTERGFAEIKRQEYLEFSYMQELKMNPAPNNVQNDK